jgi:hypothetical protein
MRRAASNIGTLIIDGKEYAVIPMEEYRRAEAEMLPDESIEQDLGDIAECRRRDAEDGKPIALAKVRKQLGL